MSKGTGGDFLFRIIWGTAFATFVATSACVFLPEWTRGASRHCGLFVCCTSYQMCEFLNREVLQTSLPWIFVGWLLNLVVLFSSKCKCSKVIVDSVRHAGTIAVISGIFLLAGVLHFIVRTIASNEDVSFGPSGIITAVSAVAMIASGVFGFCYYPNTELKSEVKSGSSRRRNKINEVEPFNDEIEGTSDIYNIPPPPEDTSFGRTARVPLQSNTVPNNFASRFWNENVAVNNDPFTADVPYPTE